MSNSRSAEEILIKALEDGRPIVPFLGAGISVDTGFPSINDLTSYFAKACHFIDSVQPPTGTSQPGYYAEYLKAHGWPDFNDLNADIWRYATNPSSSQSALENIQGLFHGAGSGVDSLIKEDDKPDVFKWIKNNWEYSENYRPQQIVDAEHLRVASSKDWEFTRRQILHSHASNLPDQMRQRGDWYELMMKLSEGNFDLVDSLFHSLARGRIPGDAHILLTQLVGIMDVKLFLTLNFDPFLEIALRNEGFDPHVVDTSREANLPSSLVIKDRLSVIKLHGSAYGLRIGEQIQVSLDSETRDRALDLIPTDALVLVMGFSGSERRMLQLLEGVVSREHQTACESILWMHWSEKPDRPVADSIKKLGTLEARVKTRRYWSVSGFLYQVLGSLRGGFPSTRSRYRSMPTRCLPEPKDHREAEPFPRERIHSFFGPGLAGTEADDQKRSHDTSTQMVAFAANLERKGYRILWVDCEEHHTTEGVVADIIDQIRAVDPQFPPFLMRTGETIDQDWDNYPSKQSDWEMADSEQFERAVERIREALQRGRYVLCLDSPVDLARPQTVHHSLPTFLPANRPRDGRLDPVRTHKFQHRIGRFFQFVGLLLVDYKRKPDAQAPTFGAIGESYLAVTLNLPGRRHQVDPDKDSTILSFCVKQVEELENLLSQRPAAENLVKCFASPDLNSRESMPDPGDHAEVNAILPALLGSVRKLQLTDKVCRLLLSVFRRPRSYLGLRSILARSDISLELPGSADAIEVSKLSRRRLLDLLGFQGDQTHSETGERLTAEGLIWFKNRIRAGSYDALSHVPHQWIDRVWKTQEPADLQAPESGVVYRLILLSVLHRRIARYYFSEVYASSHDLDAFREYLYHRVAYLRFMARLTYIAASSFQSGGTGEEIFRKITSSLGFRDDWCRELGFPDSKTSSLSYADILLISRRSELQAFHATISRESSNVLKSLNANTWIAWLERLVTEECDWMREDDFLPQTLTGSSGSEPRKAFNKALKRFEEDLRVQETNFLEEKADWGGALRSLSRRIFTKILTIRIDGLSRGLWESHVSATSFRFVEALDQQISKVTEPKDIRSNWKELKVALRDVSPTSHDLPAFSDLKTWFESVHIPTGADQEGKITPPRYVAWHLDALDLASDLVKASGFAHHLAIAKDDPGRPNQGSNAEDLLNVADDMIQGLRQAQQVLSELTYGPNSEHSYYSDSILNVLRLRMEQVRLRHALRTAIGSFQQFNPWFDNQRNRLERSQVLEPESNKTWLNDARAKADDLHELARQFVFNDRVEYNRYRALAMMLRARADALVAHDVENTLSRIDRANALLKAEIGTAPAIDRIAVLRARAECLLLDADRTLSSFQPGVHGGTWDAWRKAWSSCETRLLQARTTLSEARRVYRGRHRNVSWWLRLSRDYTQWCIEASIANVCGDPIWKSRREVDQTRISRIDEIHDLCIAATRAGLNAISWTSIADPTDTIEERANKAEALRSSGQWLCMLSCVWWRHLVDLARPRKNALTDQDLEDEFNHFWKRWADLNERHRLPKLVSDPMRAVIHSQLLDTDRVIESMSQLAPIINSHKSKVFEPQYWISLRIEILKEAKNLTRSDSPIREVLNTALHLRDSEPDRISQPTH